MLRRASSPRLRVPMESALVGCLFAAMPCGVFYGFSLYSASLQAQFSLDEGQLLDIATLPYMFGCLAPFIGVGVGRLGMRRVLLGGGVIMIAALVTTYLVANRVISLGPPHVSLVALSCCQYIGMMMFTSVAFSVPVYHYQARRGNVMAIVKCFVGVSGAVVAQIFYLCVSSRDGFVKEDAEATVGLLIWAAVVLVSTCTGALLIPEEATPNAKLECLPRLQLLWWWLLFWGLSAVVIALVDLKILHQSLALALVSSVLVPVAVLGYWSVRGPRADPQGSFYDGDACFESPVNVDFWSMLRKPEAWLLMWCCVSIGGGGATLSSSMSGILTAAGNPSDKALVLANTLYSAGNMLGRLTCMLPSDALVRSGYPRPFILLANLLSMALAHALFFLLPGVGGSLAVTAIASIVGGYAFGMVWPHMVVLASELFGSKHLSANYLFFDGGGLCLGNLLIARLLTGEIVKANSPVQGSVANSSPFSYVHLTIIALNVIGFLFVIILAQRSWSTYEDICRSSRALAESPALQTSLQPMSSSA